MPQTIKLTFGSNPYDLCPDSKGTYHVIDERGFIRFKSQFGYVAYHHAGNLSDEEADVTFRVMDTLRGEEYGSYRNGEGK